MVKLNWIQMFNEVSSSGVYSLVNESTKKVFIGHSNHIPEAVTRILKSLKNKTYRSVEMIEEQDSLELYFLEKHSQKINQKLAIRKWVDYYSNLGYTFYIPYKFTSFKLRYEISSKNRKPIVRVVLASNRNNKILVGEFETMPDAKYWVSQHYPGGKIERVIKQQSIRTEHRH